MAGMPRVRRVMAIGAHPDDCELSCGGTLALFARTETSIAICSIASGDKGARGFAPDELATKRREEAVRAASVVGAKWICLDVPDGEIVACVDLRRRIVEVIRQVRPDLIVTHWHDDYHADHQITAQLVTDASWFAASSGHGTESPALDEPVPVFYMDTLAGLRFEPTEYVDISSVWPKKEEMLRCHASQLSSTAQHGDQDLIAHAHDLARLRGHQCGVEFAEGFRPCLKWKRVRPYRLLP